MNWKTPLRKAFSGIKGELCLISKSEEALRYITYTSAVYSTQTSSSFPDGVYHIFVNAHLVHPSRHWYTYLGVSLWAFQLRPGEWALLRRLILFSINPSCRDFSLHTGRFWAEPYQKTCFRSWTNAAPQLLGICSAWTDQSSSEQSPCPPKQREFGSPVLGSSCFAFQICSCWGAQLVGVDTVTCSSRS